MEPRRVHLLRRMPRDIQVCAVAAAVLFLAYGVLYAILRVSEPALADAMLRLFGLTIVAGRETALFDAERNGMPLGVAIGLSIFDDIATLLLNITLVWLLMTGLERASLPRRILARIETQALRHRHWVRRWGLLGLAVFYLLPGFGSGPAVAASMGVLARIPARRLAIALGGGVAAVDVMWAVIVAGPAKSYPDVVWLDWLPLFVLALLLSIAFVALWRDRHMRGVVLMDWDPRPSARHEEAMAGWGIRLRDGLVEARLPSVARHVDLPRAKVLFASELLLLEAMQPTTAAALVRDGVTGLRDVAGAGAQALVKRTERAAASDEVSLAMAAAWHEQALAMVQRTGAAWAPTPSSKRTAK